MDLTYDSRSRLVYIKNDLEYSTTITPYMAGYTEVEVKKMMYNI